jgi:hypothetical protein
MSLPFSASGWQTNAGTCGRWPASDIRLPGRSRTARWTTNGPRRRLRPLQCDRCALMEGKDAPGPSNPSVTYLPGCSQPSAKSDTRWPISPDEAGDTANLSLVVLQARFSQSTWYRSLARPSAGRSYPEHANPARDRSGRGLASVAANRAVQPVVRSWIRSSGHGRRRSATRTRASNDPRGPTGACLCPSSLHRYPPGQLCRWVVSKP